MFEVLTKNIYDDLQTMEEKFDFSNYDGAPPESSKLYNVSRKAVPGLMKDETGGHPIYDWIGLRAKLYSMLVSSGRKMATAGTKEHIARKHLSHQAFRDVLNGGASPLVHQQTIASKRHEVYTLDQQRVALSALDTKRYVMSNGQTRALGHYKNNN